MNSTKLRTSGLQRRAAEEGVKPLPRCGEDYFSMGSGQSSSKLHCNRYLNGQGPPPLVQQANEGVNEIYMSLNGCQPKGKMTWETLQKNLPGFPNDNTLQLNYIFPQGMQTEKHPHPGRPYRGLELCTYLPDNEEGRQVLSLLLKAFHEQLLFTVATSKEGEDMVTTAFIPLKTQPNGSNKEDGYPDSDYLKTVRKLLKEKGTE